MTFVINSKGQSFLSGCHMFFHLQDFKANVVHVWRNPIWQPVWYYCGRSVRPITYLTY
jgi:hypothetical protein